MILKQFGMNTYEEMMHNALHPDRLTTLIVGDLDAIGADLARLPLGDPVVLSAADY